MATYKDDDYTMTEKRLLQICKERQMYQTPSLNENCYFHCKGFRSIENIEKFTECRALWLQSNGIDKIQNLEHMTKLVCLYLQENVISEMENLNLPSLKQLNLSNNQIKEIKNLENMPLLESLYLSVNRITTIEQLQKITLCKSLQVVDLARNQIEDESAINVFAELDDLRVLILTGNPIARQMRFYRKTMISKCKKLTYLDERPVFEDERRTAEAFFRGGAEAEREEHLLILCEKRAKDRAQFISMQAFLSGKPRDECLRLSDEAYKAVLENYEKTGALDLDQEDNCLGNNCYAKNRRIWKDDDVEVVSREFFEGRVTVNIKNEINQNEEDSQSSNQSQSDLPELEKVEEQEQNQNQEELNQEQEILQQNKDQIQNNDKFGYDISVPHQIEMKQAEVDIEQIVGFKEEQPQKVEVKVDFETQEEVQQEQVLCQKDGEDDDSMVD